MLYQKETIHTAESYMTIVMLLKMIFLSMMLSWTIPFNTYLSSSGRAHWHQQISIGLLIWKTVIDNYRYTLQIRQHKCIPWAQQNTTLMFACHLAKQILKNLLFLSSKLVPSISIPFSKKGRLGFCNRILRRRYFWRCRNKRTSLPIKSRNHTHWYSNIRTG